MEKTFVLTTPVYFNIFNRLDTALAVFERIKQVKPKKLYISADGPRAQKPGEDTICQEVRQRILEQIDWDCEVHKLFREENVGCKEALSSGITWLFEHEEAAIILEDDCVPEISFFEYCQTMLEKYADEKQVMMVSGTSYLAKETRDTDGIYFSRYFTIWGWATWRRAWQLYDKKMETWPAFKKSGKLKKLYPFTGVAPYLSYEFDEVANGTINTWDYQWLYTCARENGVTVVPTKNLISNIGFVGAHAMANYSRFRFMKTEPLDVQAIIYPPTVSVDMDREKAVLTEIEIVSKYYWFKLLIKKLRKIKKRIFKKK